MKGDFSRTSFDPAKHFSRVLMQQGRVQVDADWNEQTAILLHYLRTLATDLLGEHAGPAAHMGFDLIDKDYPYPGYQAKLSQIEPDPVRRQQLATAIEQQGNVVIGPGRYYVHGILVENERAILYTEQPGYPFNDETKLEALQNLQTDLLVYLDVWERHVTYVEDDSIREVALGGPDTCTRAQVVWQFKVLLPMHLPANVAINCHAADRLPALGSGRLRARARLDKPPTELCTIAPEARYRGAENQLYRVEVHQGGPATGAAGTAGATFKWSRDNGAVTFPLVSLQGETATLENLGRDAHLSLAPGDWVEIVDDGIAFGERAGVLAQVAVVERDDLTVTLEAPSGVSLPSYTQEQARRRHALLRRWDHVGDAQYAGAVPVREADDNADGLQSAWIDLEDGVQIWFLKGGRYRVGDYWLIPARTATGDVEWPDLLDAYGNVQRDADGNAIAALRPALGIMHHYAPLHYFPQDGRRTDCRCTIDTLPCTYAYAFGGAAIGPDF